MSVNTESHSLFHSPFLFTNGLLSGMNYWLCNKPFTPFKLCLKVKFRDLKINPNWGSYNFSILPKHFKDFRILKISKKLKKFL